MKKFLLFAGLIVASSLSVFAQSATFGIKGGVNFAQLHTSFSGTSSSVSTGSLTTFSAGPYADIQFTNFSIQPALNFTGRGANETEGDVHVQAKLFYLQLPIDVVYNVDIEPGVIYFGAGPYIAYGLSAKVKVSDSTGSQSKSVGFGSSEDKYKAIDAGANIVAGIKVDGGLLFAINYDYGLTNISNIAGNKTTNRVFGISVGYTFNLNK
jgi:hypothetical protein